MWESSGKDDDDDAIHVTSDMEKDTPGWSCEANQENGRKGGGGGKEDEKMEKRRK